MTFTTTLNSGDIIKIPISVVLNLLDYSKIKIISPGSLTAQLESHKIDLRDTKDKIYMNLPPHYLEWFNFTCTDAKVTLNKGRLVVQLFNVCQGSKDAGMLWNQHFDRVPRKLGLNRLMRDLVVHARKGDGALVMLNVSTDDILACTK